jgi:hypothetical protein
LTPPDEAAATSAVAEEHAQREGIGRRRNQIELAVAIEVSGNRGVRRVRERDLADTSEPPLPETDGEPPLEELLPPCALGCVLGPGPP